MKKTILIITGGTILLLVVGVWVYLLVFGTPTGINNIYSNFKDSDVNSVTSTNNSSGESNFSQTVQNDSHQALQQLTTKPVAGAIFIDNGIRYVEKGTGHVFDISFSNNNEKLVSGTTLPQTVAATFSKTGNYLAITYETNNFQNTIIGSLVKDDGGQILFDGITLPEGSHDVAFSEASSDLYYLQKNPTGTTGHKFDIIKQSDAQLFSVPLRDVIPLWGENIYLYTTPSAKQTGYLYKVDSDGLVYTTSGKPGLMGIQLGDTIVTTYASPEGLQSQVTLEGTTIDLDLGLLPEKCTSAQQPFTLYCGSTFEDTASKLPDSWYMGTVSLNDALWRINIYDDGAYLIKDLNESGREIDIAQIGTNEDGTLIWFINKNDDTLWMFDTTL